MLSGISCIYIFEIYSHMTSGIIIIILILIIIIIIIKLYKHTIMCALYIYIQKVTHHAGKVHDFCARSLVECLLLRSLGCSG